MMFNGVYTAIVTPFKEGKIDADAFEKLIDRQVEEGIHGIVVCGTTGESATLSMDEHHELISLAVKFADKRLKVIAGTGSNNTVEAEELSIAAEETGADGLLLIAPYYNKPTQEGLYQHFSSVAGAVKLPVILYDVPGRTAVSVSASTTARLYKDVPNIVGIKEATGNIANMIDILELTDKDFQLISGDDFIFAPVMSIGGTGIISVTSNVLPAEMVSLYESCVDGDYKEAMRKQISLNRFHKLMFIETSPSPVKYALASLGLCEEEIRLPLVQPAEENKRKIRTMLADYNLEVKHG